MRGRNVKKFSAFVYDFQGEKFKFLSRCKSQFVLTLERKGENLRKFGVVRNNNDNDHDDDDDECVQ